MCDQTEVPYLPGEVVWVKLRALWWPGLVQDYDALPEEITCSLRKRPIATVKFFQEESYEYVHKLDLIYHYNCSRKHEFIKKGLDLCRKKTADRPATMDFFPGDVVTAEELTNGDPNILQDEAFRPEEKPKYTSLFGSEKKKFGKGKKGKEDSPLKDKMARRKKLTSKLQAMGWLSRGITANIIYPSPDTPRMITHRRFLNKARNPDAKSDYEVHIREQKCEDEPSSLVDKKYHCVLCGYVTRRLNVIVLHFNSTHSRKVKNIFSTPSILKAGLRTSLLKMKGENRKSDSGSVSKKKIKSKPENIKREEGEVDSMDEETIKPQPVKKEKGRPGRKRKVKPEDKEQDENQEMVKKPKVLDSLLADWDEDADNDELEGESKLLGGENDDDDDDDNYDAGVDSGSIDNETASAGKSSTAGDTSVSKSKEVFEFDPDEDDNMDIDLTPNVKGFGRRIPRVIDSSKEKKQEGTEPKRGRGRPKKKKEEVDDFESLLAETSVPTVPSVPKSGNFSLDDDGAKSDESGTKPVLKEQNEADNAKVIDDRGEKSKNSNPEVDLAVDSKNPPQGHVDKSTAKVKVEKIPDFAVVGGGRIEEEAIDSLKNVETPGKSTGGGDHTYVSGNSGKRRRRSLLPLEKSDGTLDIMSMPVVMDEMVEEKPRLNKQHILPHVEGSKVVDKPTPRRVGRPPKKGGAGSRGSKSLKSSPPHEVVKSPPHVQDLKSPSPHLSPKSPPHRSPKSPSPHPSSLLLSSPKSPPQQGPKSPTPIRSPKSPHSEQMPKSPDQTPKSPTHRQSSKSPIAYQSPKRQQAQQTPKSPIRSPPMSPEGSRGPKSPPPPQSPKSPQPYQSPSHQGPKSPQGFHSPRSPPMSSPTLLSPKVLKSPPQSPVKTSVDFQSAAFLPGSKSPVKSPQASPASQPMLLTPSSPTKTIIAKAQTLGSPVGRASAGLKKVSTTGAVIVQSKPDLQPEACGLAKTLALSPSSVASSSGGTVKTIKVSVSGTPGSSPMVIGKPGTPGSQTRKVMIVQGKGGTQKMLVPTESSQQFLSNIGSGKKIIVMTKGSSGSKLVLTPEQQKILASGGKVTTSTGQVLSSKGAMLSSVAKLVSSKASTSGTSPAAGGVELSSEPPALVKTEGKKTYKIITSPQSKGNILLNTSGGQILVPVSSIAASGSGVTTSSGSKQFILPMGAKNMKLLNAVGSSGQKVILQMKSSPAKSGIPSTPKTVQPIVPKTIQSISPKTAQPISPKVVQSVTPKAVQHITTKTVQAITPKTGQTVTPKTSQPMKVTKIATMIQPVPQLTPIGSPKPGLGRPKQIKTAVVKAQPKSPRKSGAVIKSIAPEAAAASSAVPLGPAGLSPLKKNTGIIPNPNLKPIVPQAKPPKKISLAAKPAPVEPAVVSSMPAGTMQVVTGGVPGLEQIQTTLLPSVETSSAVGLPTSTQQLVAVPTEDGGQVMYLIDNSSLIGLDGSNQANLGNIILTFDNMGQPVSSAASDFTFSTPSSGGDILAEALANTQVLQSEAPGAELGLDTSGLLSSHSSSTMYQPTLSHGVLETSLTLNQPIMTPLEDLSAVSTLQPPPASGASTSVDLPSTITVPDITISTSSYASLPIPSATIQSTVFSEAQNITTFSTTSAADGSVFIETSGVEGESFLTTDSVYEQSSEGASMPLLDG